MYGAAVRRKRFSSICRLCGLASMYPASDWSVLCSGPPRPAPMNSTLTTAPISGISHSAPFRSAEPTKRLRRALGGKGRRLDVIGLWSYRQTTARQSLRLSDERKTTRTQSTSSMSAQAPSRPCRCRALNIKGGTQAPTTHFRPDPIVPRSLLPTELGAGSTNSRPN
jgi:hypothetical protein